MHHERIMLAACLAAYFGYYVVDGALLRGWVYYVTTGAMAAVAGYGLRQQARNWAGVAAGSLMVSEGSQQALCGMATIGVDLDGRDLCKRALGDDIYTALASLVLAGLVMVLWQTPRQPK